MRTCPTLILKSRPRSDSFVRFHGFTLLEILIVLALMALVTATVTLRLGGRFQQVSLEQSVSLWESADTQLRARARRTGRPVALHLEVGSGVIECAFDPEDESARTIRELGRGVRVGKYLSATREVSFGPVTVAYSARGTSETFAVELVGGDDRRWILVAGITGQMNEIADEQTAKKLLDMLIPTGVHAG